VAGPSRAARTRRAGAGVSGAGLPGGGGLPGAVEAAVVVALAQEHRIGAAMTDTIGTIIAFLLFVIVVELGLIIFGRTRRERPEPPRARLRGTSRRSREGDQRRISSGT